MLSYCQKNSALQILENKDNTMNLNNPNWIPMTDEDIEFLNNPVKKIPAVPTKAWLFEV